MMRGKNIRWIVRSSGRITGPYFEREIAEQLRNRQLVLLDEVCRPSGRWVFIRDEPVFTKIVEELRYKNLKGILEDTTTIGLDGDITDTATPIINDELTQDIYSKQSSPVGSAQDIMFQSIDDLRGPKADGTQADSYTHKRDVHVELQSEGAAKWVWAVSLVLILATIGFVLFGRLVSKPMQNKATIEQKTLEGIDALEDGQYEKALDFFEGAHHLDPKDKSLYLHLGMLRIQVAEQAVAGQKLLIQIKDRESMDQRKVYTGLAIASLYDRDYGLAEAYLSKALEIDPLYPFATINLGAMAIGKKDFSQALNHLLLAVKEGSADGAEHLMMSYAAAQAYEKDKDTRVLTEAIKSLRKYGEARIDYRLEVAIAMTYLETLSRQKFDVEKRVNSILDLDPFATEMHKHNLFVFRKAVDWSKISQWCLKMTDQFDPTPRVLALESLCLIKSGNHSDSVRKIEDAVNQRPADPLVQSVYAMVMRHMKSNMRAAVAAEKSVASDSEKLFAQPRRIMALICAEANKMECAESMWKEVLLVDSRSIDAISGLAMIQSNAKNMGRMREWVDRGMAITQGYKPLLPLMRQINRAADKGRGRGL